MDRTFQSLIAIVFICFDCAKLIQSLGQLMSRGRSQRHRDRNMELDTFGRGGSDPFREMHQIMRSFGGGFGGFDDFFGRDRLRDPFEAMMDFSDGHKKLHSSGNGGSYVCQTYVSSSTMGPDGKMRNQTFFENSAGQNQNGQTISQKHQAYKNSDGIKRIAEERMLNDQGRKIIKEKKGNNQVQETNHYYNLDENEAERFDGNWRGANQQMRFLENTQKAMQGLPYRGQGGRQEQRQIGYEQPRRQERREMPQLGYQEYRQPMQQQRTGSRGNNGYNGPQSSYKSNTRGKY